MAAAFGGWLLGAVQKPHCRHDQCWGALWGFHYRCSVPQAVCGLWKGMSCMKRKESKGKQWGKGEKTACLPVKASMSITCESATSLQSCSLTKRSANQRSWYDWCTQMPASIIIHKFSSVQTISLLSVCSELNIALYRCASQCWVATRRVLPNFPLSTCTSIVDTKVLCISCILGVLNWEAAKHRMIGMAGMCQLRCHNLVLPLPINPCLHIVTTMLSLCRFLGLIWILREQHGTIKRTLPPGLVHRLSQSGLSNKDSNQIAAMNPSEGPTWPRVCRHVFFEGWLLPMWRQCLPSALGWSSASHQLLDHQTSDNCDVCCALLCWIGLASTWSLVGW